MNKVNPNNPYIHASDMALLDAICRLETSKADPEFLEWAKAEADRRGLIGEWELELPTEAELAYYDAEGDKLAEQFDIPAGCTLPMEDVRSILALPEGEFLMRMCLYVDGKDYEGEWQPKNMSVLGYTVKLAARKGIGFSVQFKQVK